jgi:predicted nucleic acid-binding protein
LIVVDAPAAVLGMLNDGAARRLLATEPLTAPHLADSEITQALRTQVMRGTLGDLTNKAGMGLAGVLNLK